MDIKLNGTTLTITCTIGSGVPSKSGKTNIVATTNGFVAVPDSDIRVSLNVIKPKKGG